MVYKDKTTMVDYQGHNSINVTFYENKIKIFTHTDFDGAASAEVFKRLLNYSENRCFEYEIEYCETGKNGNIDQKIEEFLSTIDENSKYYGMYIMDLAPTNGELAKSIIQTVDHFELEFICFDHHKTAEYLKDIDPRFIIKVEEDGVKMSGTSLICSLFLRGGYNLSFSQATSIIPFADLVRSYDTWDWFNDPDNAFKQSAVQWNDLFWLIGRDRFVERIEKSLDLKFTDVEELLLNIEKDRKEAYIIKKLNSASFDFMQIADKKLNFALIDGEQYHSELGNKMCLSLVHPDSNDLIDFAVIRNGDRISFRSIKESVDCSEVAKLFDGGGHKRAAGGKGVSWPLK